MIVAITGGTGFVGKKLAAAHLKKGDSVKILSRSNLDDNNIFSGIKIIKGDLRENGDHLVSFVNNADILYHCAAELNDSTAMYLTHVSGTKKLLQAALGRIGRWVQLSSVGVYGPYKKGMVTEKTLLAPEGKYETTKAESDELVVKFCSQQKIDYCILRPSNIFGPTMTTQYLFQMIKLIDKGLFFFIGNPGAKANYIHLDNVVNALIRCGKEEKAIKQIFNLSDSLNMEKFVEIISRELNKGVSGLRVPKRVALMASGLSKIIPGFPLTKSRVNALTLRSWYTNDKITKELGYSHLKSLEQGLREVVRTCCINTYIDGLK